MDVDGRLIRGLQNRGEWGGLARVYKYVYVLADRLVGASTGL
jgi:hypothetical protein